MKTGKYMKGLAVTYAVLGAIIMLGEDVTGHPSADVYSGQRQLTQLESGFYGQAFDKLGVDTRIIPEAD